MVVVVEMFRRWRDVVVVKVVVVKAVVEKVVVVVEIRLWLLRCGCSKIKIAKE